MTCAIDKGDLREKLHKEEELRMAQRLGRLKRECQQLRDSPPSGVSCWPEGDSLETFSAVIIGDDDTVYAGGVFKLELEVPER
ncbi:ubiquitin-conjugating enzyme E2 T-like [Penaeus indicus]|uniref:ubiquitin-conjugating enzyme E2 T-like n=1 Tax=Penaeus indicus TaxID=29960 RepID=UPI00300D582C